MTDRRVATVLSFAAALMLAAPAHGADGAQPIDPLRLGEKIPDDAFGAYQRGLYKTALDMALARVKDGDAAAMTLAAEIYARGLGVAQNPAEAARLYGLAGEKGVPEAKFQTALMLLDGKYLPKDRAKARILLEEAMKSNHPLAAFNLAQLDLADATTDAQRKKAFDLFLTLAELGLADAQYAVSQFYLNGTGGVAYDDAKALQWVERAARQHFDTAMLDLGTWLIDGVGGKKDQTAGFGWMLRAAQAGNVAAQRRVALLYENGVGTKGDTVAAAAWYVIARRAGLHDPHLDDLLDGLTDGEMKKAIEMANRLK